MGWWKDEVVEADLDLTLAASPRLSEVEESSCWWREQAVVVSGPPLQLQLHSPCC